MAHTTLRPLLFQEAKRKKFHASVISKGYIYVVDGVDKNGFPRSVYLFGPTIHCGFITSWCFKGMPGHFSLHHYDTTAAALSVCDPDDFLPAQLTPRHSV